MGPPQELDKPEPLVPAKAVQAAPDTEAQLALVLVEPPPTPTMVTTGAATTKEAAGTLTETPVFREVEDPGMWAPVVDAKHPVTPASPRSSPAASLVRTP